MFYQVSMIKNEFAAKRNRLFTQTIASTQVSIEAFGLLLLEKPLLDMPPFAQIDQCRFG